MKVDCDKCPVKEFCDWAKKKLQDDIEVDFTRFCPLVTACQEMFSDFIGKVKTLPDFAIWELKNM
jgi:hypothetical protein